MDELDGRPGRVGDHVGRRQDDVEGGGEAAPWTQPGPPRTGRRRRHRPEGLGRFEPSSMGGATGLHDPITMSKGMAVGQGRRVVAARPTRLGEPADRLGLLARGRGGPARRPARRSGRRHRRRHPGGGGDVTVAAISRRTAAASSSRPPPLHGRRSRRGDSPPPFRAVDGSGIVAAEPFDVGGMGSRAPRASRAARPTGPGGPLRRCPRSVEVGELRHRWAPSRTEPPGPGPGRGRRSSKAARSSGRASARPGSPDRHPPVGVLGDGGEVARGGARRRAGSARRGCCTGLGQLQHGSRSTNSPWNSAGSSLPQSACMHRTCSRATARRSAKATPWSAASVPVPAEPDAEHHPAAAQVVEGGHLLGQHDRVVLGGQHHPGPEQQVRGHRRRRGQGHERVEAPPVVLEPARPRPGPAACRPAPAGGCARAGTASAKPAFLGRPGQVGRRHVAVGEEGGDPEAHGAQRPSPEASRPRGWPRDRRTGRRRPPPPAAGRRRSAGPRACQHQALDLAGGVGREGGDRPGQGQGLVEHGAVGARSAGPGRTPPPGRRRSTPRPAGQPRPAATPCAPGAGSCWPPRAARPSRRTAPAGGRTRPSGPGRHGRGSCSRGPCRRRGPRPAAACRTPPARSSRPRKPDPASGPAAPVAMAAISRRSWPEVNAWPRPVSTTAWTSVVAEGTGPARRPPPGTWPGRRRCGPRAGRRRSAARRRRSSSSIRWSLAVGARAAVGSRADHLAAVDVEHVPGDPRRLVGQEEEAHPHQVGGLAHAA